jgi:hypothetical protein
MIYGKKEAIELLEMYLQKAKEGEFGHCGVVLTGTVVGQPYGVAACDFAGELGLEVCTLEALKILQKRVEEAVDKWMLPAQDPALNHSYVRYNLANGPMGFDFITWLLSHEMLRIKNGAPAPLKVAFWKGKDAETRMKQNNREMWYHNVFQPSLKFIGAIETEDYGGHFQPIYVPRDLVDYSRDGSQVPLLKPTKPSPIEGDYITVTLREKAKDGNRNSNNEAWLKFISYLMVNEGQRVIVIRDTELADEPLDGIETYPEASKDLETRFAVYSGAKMNFFVENGPASLCIHSTAPYTMFINLDESERLRTKHFVEWAFHLKSGDQYPWSNSKQKLFWKPDTFENIVEAWKEMKTKI